MCKQVEYYSTMKTYELLKHKIRINVEGIMLSEQADTKGYNLHNSTYLVFGKGKNRGTKLD